MPEEVVAIRTRRFQILNVWRPLVPHLRDWPLALCDMRTVSREDLVEADLISPGFQGENMFLYFSPHYKFYFRDRQTCDEVWVFKQFDSMDGVASHIFELQRDFKFYPPPAPPFTRMGTLGAAV
ncbi:hypothetical protein BDV09DRAFT_168926 [Aspergillus tetrazonus]